MEAERDAGFLLRNISRLEEHMSRKRHEERALAANLTEKASSNPNPDPNPNPNPNPNP